jgi:peptidoglycan/LPS O-acetylase OafA/YrhL
VTSTDRAKLARRYWRVTTVAGWAAIVGAAVIVAGAIGRHLVTPWLAVLVPAGVAVLVAGGAVSVVANQIADRYREPIDGGMGE